MVVINVRYGQLCNRIILFAHFIANSIQNNYKLLNLNFTEYSEYFDATQRNDFEGHKISTRLTGLTMIDKFFGNALMIFGRIGHRISSRILNLHFIRLVDPEISFDLERVDFQLAAKHGIVLVDGWLFRDYNAILKHKKEILRTFKPRQEYLDMVKSLNSECRSLGQVLIGVHMRRGDYIHFNHGKWFYSNEDYLRIMHKLEILCGQINKSVVFLVCSDQNVVISDFLDVNVVAGFGHFIVDLYSLSQCDYIIGPPSTFSMWASFYGDVPLLQLKEIDQKIDLADFSIAEI
jgi:hypothetical protein